MSVVPSQRGVLRSKAKALIEGARFHVRGRHFQLKRNRHSWPQCAIHEQLGKEARAYAAPTMRESNVQFVDGADLPFVFVRPKRGEQCERDRLPGVLVNNGARASDASARQRVCALLARQ
jgi:hypothetical protein